MALAHHSGPYLVRHHESNGADVAALLADFTVGIEWKGLGAASSSPIPRFLRAQGHC